MEKIECHGHISYLTTCSVIIKGRLTVITETAKTLSVVYSFFIKADAVFIWLLLRKSCHLLSSLRETAKCQEHNQKKHGGMKHQHNYICFECSELDVYLKWKMKNWWQILERLEDSGKEVKLQLSLSLARQWRWTTRIKAEICFNVASFPQRGPECIARQHKHRHRGVKSDVKFQRWGDLNGGACQQGWGSQDVGWEMQSPPWLEAWGGRGNRSRRLSVTHLDMHAKREPYSGQRTNRYAPPKTRHSCSLSTKCV